MKKTKLTFVLPVVLASALLAGSALFPGSPQQSNAVQRGEYLVKGGGCGDCHTPLKMGPSGPEWDQTRLLSGHPEAPKHLDRRLPHAPVFILQKP